MVNKKNIKRKALLVGLLFILLIPFCKPYESSNPFNPGDDNFLLVQFILCLQGDCAASTSACPTLDWKTVTPECWPTYQASMQATIAAGSCGSPTVSTFGTYAGTQKWSSGVLAPDGHVRGITQNQNQFLNIDPDAQTGTLTGATNSATGWRGGVLAFNEKIYGIPSNNTLTFIEFDPVAETNSDFNNTAVANPSMRGGAIAPNGKIYAMPQTHTSVVIVDPDTLAVTEITGTGNGFLSATLGPDGKIYGIGSSSSILVIDPDTDTATTMGPIPGTSGYVGAVLAPNGKIYGIPSGADRILVIDPGTQTFSTFTSGVVDATGEKWVGGTLGANGKIYAVPGTGKSTILEIDPDTETATVFSSGHTARWWGAVAALNGKIYGVPFTGTYVIEIDPCANSQFDDNVLLSPFYNKF